MARNTKISRHEVAQPYFQNKLVYGKHARKGCYKSFRLFWTSMAKHMPAHYLVQRKREMKWLFMTTLTFSYRSQSISREVSLAVYLSMCPLSNCIIFIHVYIMKKTNTIRLIFWINLTTTVICIMVEKSF